MANKRQSSLEKEILQDHKELKEYFQNYKRSGDLQWFNELVFHLSRHSVGEELIVYPLLDTLGDEGKKLADESREEHSKAKELLSKLEKLSHGPREDFDKELGQLMTDLTEHMDKEEKDDLRIIKDGCSLKDRNKAGKQFEFRKKIMPKRGGDQSSNDKPVTLEEAMGILLAPVEDYKELIPEV
jgi:iron-sulfur cluster repair protein YtfE (RIC family)